MAVRPMPTKLIILMVAALTWAVSSSTPAQTKPATDTSAAAESKPAASRPASAAKPAKPVKAAKAGMDHSGRKHKGKASFYSRRFAGKKMADGTPMNPDSNAAASKTLPLGTKAKVTNLRNGKSAVVEIRDRGPYVAGRNIDVTPKTAQDLGMTKQGVAQVEITPLEVPQPDGGTKPPPN
jgi:rare lipoprotein A